MHAELLTIISVIVELFAINFNKNKLILSRQARVGSVGLYGWYVLHTV